MSVIPLAAMLVHHCVDEDGMVCIEMHAPTIREMAIAAKDEHDSLRARIAELEARLQAICATDPDEWYALYQAEEDRREKAEAERDEWRTSRIETARQRDAFEIELRALRAERDRYLAAIRQRADAKTIGEMSAADIALRRIAEEAK